MSVITDNLNFKSSNYIHIMRAANAIKIQKKTVVWFWFDYYIIFYGGITGKIRVHYYFLKILLIYNILLYFYIIPDLILKSNKW